jgi:hypothetical protein
MMIENREEVERKQRQVKMAYNADENGRSD